MARFRLLVLILVAAALSVVALRRSVHGAGRAVPGGVLIGDVAMYDRVSRFVLGGLFRGIAADIASAAPAQAKVLEIGCGPGLLSIDLGRAHGLEVTGLDLDPAMIDRARANAEASSAAGAGPAPTFVVGDVATLPFADSSFDVVASTFSMHHWSDRDGGLREIARVLRSGGRALIWDLKPGVLPFHPEVDATAMLAATPLGPAAITDWRWPGPLVLAHRAAFTRD